MSIMRHSCPVGLIFSAFAGMATGASLYLLYFRLRRELEEIRVLVIELKQEIAALSEATGRRRRQGNRTKNSGYFSVTASSGDDDEDFVDAVAGLSDAEMMAWQNGPTFFERTSVQFATPVSVEMGTEQSDEQFLRQIDALFTAGSEDDFERAYLLMKKRERKMCLNAEFQWRFSKALYNVGNSAGKQGQKTRKKELLYQAKDAALACINLDSQVPQGHTWYAIALGTVGDYEPAAEKIKNGYEIKKHIQRSIDLNPQDPTPHYMLGRWCFSVYMLSWLERQAASALFGTPPTATVEEALDHFMRAENLRPGTWKENSLYIAKCLIEKRQYDKAVSWLRKAQSDPDDTDMDPVVQTEVANLLAKYDH